MFCRDKSFGEFQLESDNLSSNYLAVVTEWILGDSFDDFLKRKINNVDQFFRIAEQLFTALSDLKANNLCHDDLHPGNILMEKRKDVLSQEEIYHARIIHRNH